MAHNHSNSGNNNGRGQQGPFDSVPPTQYLGGNSSYSQQQQNADNDQYGDPAYYEYDRPDSFDVSYYTRDDDVYTAGSGNAPSLLSPDGPAPPAAMMGDLPPRRRRNGRPRDEDIDSVSEGAYSIRSSL
ncbi:hypothetical protein H4R19_003241, partial [Coemansia spiralis]